MDWKLENKNKTCKASSGYYLSSFHNFLPNSFFFIFIYLFIYLFIIYFWLRWVFISVRGLSLVVASGGHSSSRCAGLSLSRPLLLRSTGSSRAGSVVVAQGPSGSAACGIFPDQGSNPCPLHWQADSQPLRQQGSPSPQFFTVSSPAHFLSHSRLWNLFKEFNIPFTEAIILFPFCTL